MKVIITENEKNSLEFIIEGERHTLPNYLKEKIASDPSVEFCAYRLDHPLDKKARFIVKTSGKASPKKAVEDAIKTIKEELAEFKKEVEKLK